MRKRDGVTLTYSYDAMNRNTLKSVPASASGAAGYSVYYDYDIRGLQTYARFGSTSGQGITNAYDGYGRMTSSTASMGGASRAVSFQYDAAGNRTRVAHPDGVYFDVTFDAGSRMTGASWTTGAGTTPSILGISYDNLARRTAIGRGLSNTQYGYDAIGITVTAVTCK